MRAVVKIVLFYTSYTGAWAKATKVGTLFHVLEEIMTGFAISVPLNKKIYRGVCKELENKPEKRLRLSFFIIMLL